MKIYLTETTVAEDEATRLGYQRIHNLTKMVVAKATVDGKEYIAEGGNVDHAIIELRKMIEGVKS